MKVATIITESDNTVSSFENLHESDETVLGQELKAVLSKEMENGELNESVTAVGILGWLLASNTVLDILGKYTAKILRKINLDKVANKADAVHKWAHNNEKAMVGVISQVISPFIKDPAKRENIAKGLFIAILAALGIKASIGAVNAIRGANVGTAALSLTKGALKGRDITNVGKEILAAL